MKFLNIFRKPRESNNTPVKSEDKVPLKEKMAFGAGGVGAGIQEYADNALIGPIFIIGVGISPATMGLCNVLYRAWDAITDAAMGWVTDNTRTRWGRRRPFLLIGAILMAVVMPFIFMFDRDWDMIWVIMWMIFFQLMLTTTQTIYNIPYQCLSIEITADSNERTRVGAWRGYFGQIVMLVAGWTWWLCLLPPFRTDGEPDPVKGAPWVIGGLAFFACILGILPALFTKERTAKFSKNQESIPVIKSIKMSLKSKPFLILVGFILIGVIGGGLTGGMGWFVRFYYACEGSQDLAAKIGGVESVVRIFFAIAGTIFFQWFSVQTSKRLTLATSGTLIIFSALSSFFLYTPTNPYLSIIPILIIAFAQAGLWMMVLSMLGDVVDDDEIKTHTRREGAFSSVFSWVQKVTYSFTAGISGFLVVWAGYDSANREYLSPEATMNMRLMMVFIPLVMMGIALGLLSLYPLTNRRIHENRKMLDERHRLKP